MFKRLTRFVKRIFNRRPNKKSNMPVITEVQEECAVQVRQLCQSLSVISMSCLPDLEADNVLKVPLREYSVPRRLSQREEAILALEARLGCQLVLVERRVSDVIETKVFTEEFDQQQQQEEDLPSTVVQINNFYDKSAKATNQKSNPLNSDQKQQKLKTVLLVFDILRL